VEGSRFLIHGPGISYAEGIGGFSAHDHLEVRYTYFVDFTRRKQGVLIDDVRLDKVITPKTSGLIVYQVVLIARCKKQKQDWN
jgi:hypothetical protein